MCRESPSAQRSFVNPMPRDDMAQDPQHLVCNANSLLCTAGQRVGSGHGRHGADRLHTLCHRNPASVVAQARQLTAVGDCVAIHYDARRPGPTTTASGRSFATIPACLRPPREMRLGRVEPRRATLEGLKAALAAFPDATHLYLLSGDCMAIKTAEWAHAFLGRATPTISNASISPPGAGSRPASRKSGWSTATSSTNAPASPSSTPPSSSRSASVSGARPPRVSAS
jgi:hypothetical protein